MSISKAKGLILHITTVGLGVMLKGCTNCCVNQMKSDSHSTLNSWWTALRHIQSGTDCLLSGKSVSSTIIPIYWDVTVTNRCNCMQWILFLCLVHSTCFGRHTRPSSGVQSSTVSTATGTIVGWRRLSRLLVPEDARHCLASSGTSSRDNLRQPMIVPVAVDTVELCIPYDGRVCRPKHVEWTKQRNKIHCIQLQLLVIS